MRSSAPPSPSTWHARRGPWKPTRWRCRATSPIAAGVPQGSREKHHLAVAAGLAGVVSAARAGAGGTLRIAGGRWRPVTRAPHRRLPAWDLSVVLAGSAGTVVVARSARGAVPGGVSLHPQPRQDAAQR